MVNFDFLGKSLGIISPPHFVFDFSKKNVSSINRPNFIAVISWDMGQYVYCSVFEVNLIFQIYIMQKLRQGD